MAKKQKYYVVWSGLNPGIFTSWDECKAQVEGQSGARFKSFPTMDEAERAFYDGLDVYEAQRAKDKAQEKKQMAECESAPSSSEENKPATGTLAIAVDAACAGNPGVMEYQGVDLTNGKQIFHQGPFPQGTNNIGEFLAIVHGLGYLKQRSLPYILYSDSRNAINWVRQKKCKTKLERNEVNAPLLDLVARAEKWLLNNTYTTEIRKWETKEWGEIPADFGRK